MKQVRNHHSKVLGQARGVASTHIDASVDKELGWGAHTLTVGNLTYGSAVNQLAATYIGEDGLLFVAVADRTDKFATLMRVHREERKFVIPFRRIEDIQIQRKDALAESLDVFSSPDEELRRQRIAIHLRRDRERGGSGVGGTSETLCWLDVHDSPIFARHLISAWTSYRVLFVSRIGRLSATASPKLALEYLGEVSNDLRALLSASASASTSASATPSSCDDFSLKKMGELFEEFAEEVQLDLHLKECVFRTREFVVQTAVAIRQVMEAPSDIERDIEIKLKYLAESQPNSPVKSPKKDGASYFSFDDPSIALGSGSSVIASVANTSAVLAAASTAVLVGRLNSIIVRRLVVIRKALLALSAMLLCSEAVACRSIILSGPPPLDLDSWLRLLCTDIFANLCDRLKLTADGIGEPVGKDEGELGFLRRSILDIQAMMLSELVCVCATVYSKPQRIGISRTLNAHDAAPVVLGDVFVRQSGWDACLERIIARVSSLLDDMLNSERAERRGGGAGDSRGGGGGVGAGGTGRGGVSVPGQFIPAAISVPKSPKKGPTTSGAGSRLRGDSGSPRPKVTQTSSKHSSFETQEILLLRCCQLLRALAWDNAKVRETLQTDLLPLFAPIITLLNVICPRMKSAISESALLSAAALDQGVSVGMEARGNGVSRFLRCLPAGGCGGGGETVTGLSAINPLRPASSTKTQLLFPWCPLERYSSTGLLIDKGSMRLLHLARREIEECINVLSLGNISSFRSAAKITFDDSNKPALEVSPRPPATPRRAAAPGSVATSTTVEVPSLVAGLQKATLTIDTAMTEVAIPQEEDVEEETAVDDENAALLSNITKVPKELPKQQQPSGQSRRASRRGGNKDKVANDADRDSEKDSASLLKHR